MTAIMFDSGKAGPMFDQPVIRKFFDGVELAELRVKFDKAQQAIMACATQDGCEECKLSLKITAARMAQFVEDYGNGAANTNR